MSQREKAGRPEVVLVNRCFVVRPDSKDGRLLLIRRSPTERHNAGLWEVPGGKLEKGEDLTKAQEMEVLEETGLLVHPVQRLCFVESFLISKGKYAGLPYVALFHITQAVGGKFGLSDEHDGSAWVDYDEMLAYKLTPEVHKAAIVLEQYLR